MSATDSSNAAGFGSTNMKGTAVQTGQSPPRSNPDWITTSLLAAKALAAGTGDQNFPYVKNVFGTAIILLETVEVRSWIPSLRNPANFG